MKSKIIIFSLVLVTLWGTPHKAAAQFFAVRADALAALTGTLHLGAEASVADRWTIEASGYWNPIRTSDFSMNFGAMQIGPRYWFYESFVGHFIGAQLSWIDYDLGRRTRHYDGNAYGFSVSYGYAWMLSKRWNVALEAGVGLFHTRDTQRDPTVSDWEDEYIYRTRRWTLLPSRLEVSFSYLF